MNLLYAFAGIAAVINMFNLGAGLLSALTGRSHAPGLLRRLRRSTAATPEDQRMLGMSLVLLSVGQLMMLVALVLVVTLAAAAGSGGRAPIVGLYMVAFIGFLSSVACTFASMATGSRLRYREAFEDGQEPLRKGRPKISD